MGDMASLDLLAGALLVSVVSLSLQMSRTSPLRSDLVIRGALHARLAAQGILRR